MASRKGNRSKWGSLAFTALALLAILLCIRLGFWQYDRYQIRNELTLNISSALSREPIELTDTNQGDLTPWMRVSLSGVYDQKFQRVFRGHYFQDQYGLEVLSLFIPANREIPPVWIDRGWMRSEKSADAAVKIPIPPQGLVTVSGILRKYEEGRATKGLFFALPAPKIGRIDERSLQEIYSGETFHNYVKLQNSSGDNQLDISPTSPPGTGPHLAYAIQWWIFAMLIAGTRIALFKSEKST